MSKGGTYYGIEAHPLVVALVDAEEPIRQRIANFMAGIGDAKLDVILPQSAVLPMQGLAIARVRRPPAIVTIRLDLTRVRDVNGSKGVRISCAEADIDRLKVWHQRHAMTEGIGA